MDVLNHFKFGARLGRVDLHLVHERAYQENAASRGFQKVFRRQRIRNLARLEPLALIANHDDKIIGRALKRERNLFVRVVGIAM